MELTVFENIGLLGSKMIIDRLQWGAPPHYCQNLYGVTLNL